jgi:hypothetical protein
VATINLTKRQSKKPKGRTTIIIRFNSGKAGTGTEKMFQLCCDAIPIVGRDGCHLQDMIARSLGGIQGEGKEDSMGSNWYFPSKHLAMDHFTLFSLCLVGDAKYYAKLKSDIIKRHSSLADDGDVVVVGCEMEPSETNCKSGVVGYYILAHKSPWKLEDRTELVIAVSSRSHSRLRASGPVSKKMLGKGGVTHFFRLL